MTVKFLDCQVLLTLAHHFLRAGSGRGLGESQENATSNTTPPNFAKESVTPGQQEQRSSSARYLSPRGAAVCGIAIPVP